MKTIAIVQARMGSSRLPGKVLRPILGKPMIERIIERLKTVSEIDEIMIATTTLSEDSEIVRVASQSSIQSFRGSNEDVLSRYYEAAKQVHADIVIRITGDCPLIDPMVLETMLKQFKSSFKTAKPIDYMSNTLKRTFPRGLDVEIFSFKNLKIAHEEACEQFQREHVTPFIYQHSERFRLENFENVVNYSHHRWTVDTEEDFELVTRIYETLDQNGKIFTTEQVLELLDQAPELARINAHIEQKKN